MKIIVRKNEAVFIGKIDEIIAQLTTLEKQYHTVKTFIDAKTKKL